MTNKNLIKILISLAFVFFANQSFAADEIVEMLNKSGKESMVYSKKIVRINVGDTVIWKATDKGHNVEFIKGGVPEGVENLNQNLIKILNISFLYLVFMPTGVPLIKTWE